MPLTQFTAAEAANITNAVLDHHLKGQPLSQTIQNKPLLKALLSKPKPFAAGKDLLTWPVKGNYSAVTQGFSGDDTVAYSNPTNVKRASVAYYQLHTGITCTHDELKRDGISITDSTGSGKSKATRSDVAVLVNLWKDKIEDLTESRERNLQLMMWRDGTQDAKEIPGLLSFILDDPTAAGSTLGIDRVANTWWRNRASLAIDSSTASNQNLVNKLQTEYRQLRRYGGNPRFFPAGSAFLEALEKELRSKGNYTLEGWNKTGAVDFGMADVQFKGIMVQYEPTLDDIGRSKYGYWLDMNHIHLRPMEGEWEKTFTPERPPEAYCLFQAVVDTAALTCDQPNSCGVFSIA
jgi:hypothetical protein